MRINIFTAVAAFATLAGIDPAVLAQVDSSIPLQGKPPRISNPADVYEQILRIKQQKLDIEERERAAERERAMTRERAQQPAAKENNTGSTARIPPALAPLLTYGSFNGRGWHTFSSEAKVIYIWAAGDALSRENPTAQAKYVAGGLTYSETAAAIDRFYSEPENLLIDVIDTLRVVAMKANGAPQADIDSAISLDRRVANTPTEASAPDGPAPTTRPQGNEDLINTRISGEFHGWVGDTIFKLDNGQVWQQAYVSYKASYLWNPKVFIYTAAGGYRMRVDGVVDSIAVKRIQ